jgi:ABC-type oligopeptide transport system substrate-binding subunit
LLPNPDALREFDQVSISRQSSRAGPCAPRQSRLVVALTLGCVLLASACTAGDSYFGRTTAPSGQRLVYNNNAEPESLDPQRVSGVAAFQIMDALFDGLTKSHPQTLEPMAALATHYETNADQTQFTFYLRGHPQPRGTRLPNTDTLRDEYAAGQLREDFAHGHTAPPDTIPARWSDGTIITAMDFVYSWRRAVAPETAADYANLMYYIKNAEEINAGKVRLRDRRTSSFRTDAATGKELTATAAEIAEDTQLARLAQDSEVVPFQPEDLGVSAPEDFTLRVEMRAPTAFFLKVLYLPIYCPVPRQAIEGARSRGPESSWTEARNIITSGAFKLQTWVPYDRITVVKNPLYYEAELVSLSELTFLPITNQTTNVNLYKAGKTDFMLSNQIPQAFIPLLRGKRDFRITPSFETELARVNLRRAPFDAVVLRYALNMATDKQALADFLGAGETRATGLVPPLAGYDALQRLDIEVAGKTYDVLAYNPAAARELLAGAGFPGGVGRDGRRLNAEIMIFAGEKHRQIAEVLQQQWRTNLGVDAQIVSQEIKVFIETENSLSYNAVSESNWIGDYIDPNTFLDLFVSNSSNNATGWADEKYDEMLSEANSATDAGVRMKKLAECEKYMLRAMPVMPLYYATNVFLLKPYIRGMTPTLNDLHPFKYVRVDVSWKADAETVQTAAR